MRLLYTPPAAAIVLTAEELALPTTLLTTYSDSELVTYEAEDLAAQITLYEHELFRYDHYTEAIITSAHCSPVSQKCNSSGERYNR